MKYSKGYKYQLEETYSIKTPIVGYDITSQYYTLKPDGNLKIEIGYAWDGASGPTFDTDSSMIPSLVHDVFCQMMRDKLISYDKWQDSVNEFFYEHCIACGMCPGRAKLWYKGVELGDAGNPNQGSSKIIYTI